MAYECIIRCSFPLIFQDSYLNNFESSISTAPPPGIIVLVFATLLTIIIASFKLLSASFKNYSAPPLRIKVAVLLLGHPVKKLYLLAPTLFSSNNSQLPKYSYFKSVKVVRTLAPVAFSTLLISSLVTLPAQKIFQSAKY